MAQHHVVSGDTITLGQVYPTTVRCPDDIRIFLSAQGWATPWGHSNDTVRFSRDTYQDFTWEQAMAVEFYKFITLGGR